MSCMLNIQHHHYLDIVHEFKDFGDPELKLIGHDTQVSVKVHTLVLAASSVFLRHVLESISFLDLSSVYLPDISSETLGLLSLFLYDGTLQCTDEQYQNIIEVMQLLGIDCSQLNLSSSCDKPNRNEQEFLEDIVHLELSESDNGSSPTRIVVDDNTTDTENCGLNHVPEFTNVTPSMLSEAEVNPQSAESPAISQSEQNLDVSQVASNSSVYDNAFPCSMCDKLFSTLQLLDAHVKHHHAKYKCSQCHFVCSRLKFFLQHRNSVHRSPARQSFECQHCHKMFSTKTILHRHILNAHKEKKFLNAHKEKKFLSAHKEKKFRCKLCVYSTVFLNDLRWHKRSVHSNDADSVTNRPFKCKLCDFAFRFRTGRDRHVRSIHSLRTPHKCHICTKSFKRGDGLKKHLCAHL